MAGFCLIPSEVDKFKGALVSGKIDPAKLADMTSEQRRNFFEGIVGKPNARGVNTLFETKLLLKNQKQGYITWAKTVAGLKPEVRRDLIDRIQKLENVLDPVEEKAFLKDLASAKLGVDVSVSESRQIAELSRQVEESRQAMEKGGDRLAYGRAKVALGNYINGLKEEAGKLRLGDLKRPGAYSEAISRTAGLSKSIKASLDNSAIFRQGWKTLWTNPGIWAKNSLKTWTDAAKEFKGESAVDEVMADIISRENFDLMRKAKLAVGNIEEAYPSSIPEKIPYLGRAYKASQSAYTGFVYRQRADVFDKMIELAKDSGVNLKDKEELRAIGNLVNSLTGRGDLGRLEGKAADAFNNVFFSPRFLKSNIDTLSAGWGIAGLARDKKVIKSKFARKQAAKNLLKIVGGTATVLAIAETLKPGSIEWDPRSSDFGKIKIGNTRFDVSGGMSSIVTLASRMVTRSTKTGSGGVKPIGEGFAETSIGDLLFQFAENKLSPTSRAAWDIIKGQDFDGNKPTIGSTLNTLFTPLPALNYKELRDDPKSANTLVAMLSDALGIGTNTYGMSKTNWEKSTAKELKAFREAVGDVKFKQANEQYNREVNEMNDRLTADGGFDLLPDKEKDSLITTAKERIRSRVLSDFDFDYVSEERDEAVQSERDRLLEGL